MDQLQSQLSLWEWDNFKYAIWAYNSKHSSCIVTKLQDWIVLLSLYIQQIDYELEIYIKL